MVDVMQTAIIILLLITNYLLAKELKKYSEMVEDLGLDISVYEEFKKARDTYDRTYVKTKNKVGTWKK